jgi:hypothetical protein
VLVIPHIQIANSAKTGIRILALFLASINDCYMQTDFATSSESFRASLYNETAFFIFSCRTSLPARIIV